VTLYVQGYSVTIDSLLGIVILFQTYIIWIQVEIGLRQNAVFQQEFEPSFKPVDVVSLPEAPFHGILGLDVLDRFGWKKTRNLWILEKNNFKKNSN